LTALVMIVGSMKEISCRKPIDQKNAYFYPYSLVVQNQTIKKSRMRILKRLF
jgi:hypothetical protein